uniref:Uncharacterized protein n=1 Tax=Lepeophtheirus salmonis TaxID=72036 RepID=A0A0K2VHT1_LEPSM
MVTIVGTPVIYLDLFLFHKCMYIIIIT